MRNSLWRNPSYTPPLQKGGRGDFADITNLKFRYLLWLYKTVKEDVDRVERKGTQLDIDKRMYEYIGGKIAREPQGIHKKKLTEALQEFKIYIEKKEKEGNSLKFKGGKLDAGHQFLLFKLQAVEESAVKELGGEALKKIKTLYEEEMQKRILESKEHT